MPEKTIHFAMALHAHQPTGNFDHVFRESLERCYAPLLDQLDRHREVPITLHYSGILLEWLDENEPAYLDRLKEMVARGQVELLGGGFGEPILVMLSDRDRLGQIRAMNGWLERRFGAVPRGAWLTERVWEQSLVHDLAGAGIEHVIVDDSHLRLSGLRGDGLLGSFVTEDRGRTIRLFPSSEALRYHIPFRTVEETIGLLRSKATEEGDRLLMYGDDTEKFGGWPGTYEHVYENGWLSRFFDALEENRSWLKAIRLSDALALDPLGKVYVPDASYREMTEWALPTEAREEFEALRRDMGDELSGRAAPFFRGGAWRTFLAKYPESGEMYGKMMDVSRRVAAMPVGSREREAAELELYRGQTNCAYWHGVFGGLYLPHLRAALYSKLISAENMADAAAQGENASVGAETLDLDFDGFDEVRLSSDKLNLFLHPRRGGHLYELDDRERAINLLAGMSRRREPYHGEVRETAGTGEGEDVSSIHGKTTAKQEGLDKLLVYDPNRREGLVDHFFAPGTTLDEVAAGGPVDLGDFASSPYDAGIEEGEGMVRVRLVREGEVRAAGGDPIPVRVEKEIALAAGRSSFTARYRVIHRGERPLETLFGVGFAWALLAGNAPDRYLLREGKNVGPLASRLDLEPCLQAGAKDEWLGVETRIILDREAPIWVFPVETVSLSEGGFEAVYQCTVLIPRWSLNLVPGEEWSVEFEHRLLPVRRD